MIANIRAKLNDLEQWMDRLQDLEVVEVGPHIDIGLDDIADRLEYMSLYYRRLVEKAENERVE